MANTVTIGRQSQASHSAARADKDAPAPKTKTTNGTPSKPTNGKTSAKPTKASAKKATPKVKEPSVRDQQREAAKAAFDAAVRVLADWNPARHHGISRETARAGIAQLLGYVSGEIWSYTEAHPALGPRDVGRPAPKSTKK